jgi:N-acyl-D-amino-acid deacylase
LQELSWTVDRRPKGGKRMLQKVDGFRFTLVNGEVIVQGVALAEAMPGRLIRGQQS